MVVLSEVTTAEEKFTAAQIKNDCPSQLQDLGKRVTVHLAKVSAYDDKADQHRIAAGQLLAEARKACDDGGFDAFREKYCPRLGKSRAYELLAIASKKKTIEENRAESRERQTRSRANRKIPIANSVTVTENEAAPESQDAPTAAKEAEAPGIVRAQTPASTRPPGAVSTKDDAVGKFTDFVLELIRRTRKQKVERFAETAVQADDLANLGKFFADLAILKKSGVVKSVTGFVSQGNDVDTAESAEVMKAAQEVNSTEDAGEQDYLVTDESYDTGDAAAA